MGLRDQNNGKKIGINGSRIYHVTTLQAGFTDLRVCYFHLLVLDVHIFLIRLRVVLPIYQVLKLISSENKVTSDFGVYQFLHVNVTTTIW